MINGLPLTSVISRCGMGCEEAVAFLEPDSDVTIEEWQANMHFHEGCRTGHVGKVCRLETVTLPGMEEEGR